MLPFKKWLNSIHLFLKIYVMVLLHLHPYLHFGRIPWKNLSRHFKCWLVIVYKLVLKVVFLPVSNFSDHENDKFSNLHISSSKGQTDLKAYLSWSSSYDNALQNPLTNFFGGNAHLNHLHCIVIQNLICIPKLS